MLLTSGVVAGFLSSCLTLLQGRLWKWDALKVLLPNPSHSDSIGFIAFDLSEIAIDRARHYCGDAPNVEFHAQDIRSGIPAHDVQVCLVSDVLYYLSQREISSFAIELASRMNSSGQMVFANEWNKSYRGLTHPEKACEVIVNTGRWAKLSFAQKSIDDDSCLWVGVFEVAKRARSSAGS